MCLQTQGYRLDSMVFATLLLQKLEQCPNFKLVTNSEVSELYHDSKSGIVNAARVLGKRGEALNCDAVVVCTGAQTEMNLSNMLSVRCPVLPLKSYSFNMPGELGSTGFIFHQMNVCVAPLGEKEVRV